MQPINPRVDIAFKKTFGVIENTDLLISLIKWLSVEANTLKKACRKDLKRVDKKESNRVWRR